MRTFRQLAVIVAVLGGGLVIAATPASAPPTQVCWEEDNEVKCGTKEGEPGQEAEPAGTGSGGGTPTGTWTRQAYGGLIPLDPEGDTQCEVDGEPGYWVRDTLRAPTGEVLAIEATCLPDDPADPSPGSPAQPPAPPTRDEILDAAALPVVEIAADPSGRGLTGLESRFWVADPLDEVSASAVAVRGWTASGSLTATNLLWETGDGGDYQTTTSGSSEEPAVRHTYENLPAADDDEPDTTWPVEVAVTWEGDWSISGYGVEFVVGDLDATTIAGLDYEIIEVVGALEEVDESS